MLGACNEARLSAHQLTKTPYNIAVSAGDDVWQFDLLAACQQLYSGDISYTNLLNASFRFWTVRQMFPNLVHVQLSIMIPVAKHVSVQLHVCRAVVHAYVVKVHDD